MPPSTASVAPVMTAAFPHSKPPGYRVQGQISEGAAQLRA
jgi:hypothetical protein